MRPLTKKLTAMILITVMLLTSFAVTANAQTSEGTIVDMSDILNATPTKIVGDDTTAATNLDTDGDGTNDTLKVSGATNGVLHYSSYDLSDIPLDADSRYVITFTLKKYAIAYASYLWIDPAMNCGFKFSNTQSANLNVGSGAWLAYNNIGITPKTDKEVVEGLNHTCLYFKIVVDVPTGMASLMMLTDSGAYRVINADVFDASAVSNLCFSFGALSAQPACFTDLKVYKDEASASLVDMSDIFAMTPTTSATATVTNLDTTGDNTPDLLKIDGPGTDYASYDFSNIPLNSDSRYVITFSLKKYFKANASYFWIDPELKYGFRFSDTQSASIQGTTSASWTTYASKGVTVRATSETVETKNCNCMSFKVIVDGPADKLVLMVLANDGTYKEVNTDIFDISGESNLRLSFGETGDARPSYFGNLMVYEAKAVSINDGTSTEKLDVLYDTYTLPSARKAGYVLNGWRINGGDEVVAVGTTVNTVDLVSLEAVYTKTMSKAWYQFKDNESGNKDIRIVSVIDSLNYDSIGYNVTMKYTVDGEEKSHTDSLALKNVYSSLTAKYGAEVVTLETLGCDKDGGYITAFVIRNIPADIGELTLELTPYQVELGETEPTTGDMITVTFDVENGTIAE